MIFMFNPLILKKMKKLFIFDVDGVLLNLWPAMRAVFSDYHKMSLTDEDWDDIIIDFLHDPKPYLEFGDYFHNSFTFGHLLPIQGMQKLVFELRDRGFDLAIISSSNPDPTYVEKRRKNLEEHYEDSFEKVICVGMKQTKKEALRATAEGYDEVYFCDDNPLHLLDSVGIVTTPIWFANPHHEFMWEHVNRTGILTARNAEEIREIVLKK